jgi:hypothetical protein
MLCWLNDICDTDTGVRRDSCNIGSEGDYCDKYDTDTSVCTDGCKIGQEGEYCDRWDTDTGVYTDGCKIGLEGAIVIYVILIPVYVNTVVG